MKLGRPLGLPRAPAGRRLQLRLPPRSAWYPVPAAGGPAERAHFGPGAGRRQQRAGRCPCAADSLPPAIQAAPARPARLGGEAGPHCGLMRCSWGRAGRIWAMHDLRSMTARQEAAPRAPHCPCAPPPLPPPLLPSPLCLPPCPPCCWRCAGYGRISCCCSVQSGRCVPGLHPGQLRCRATASALAFRCRPALAPIPSHRGAAPRCCLPAGWPTIFMSATMWATRASLATVRRLGRGWLDAVEMGRDAAAHCPACASC